MPSLILAEVTVFTDGCKQNRWGKYGARALRNRGCAWTHARPCKLESRRLWSSRLSHGLAGIKGSSSRDGKTRSIQHNDRMSFARKLLRASVNNDAGTRDATGAARLNKAPIVILPGFLQVPAAPEPPTLSHGSARL
eukprot:4516977-Pyramimonas_sp.AAC.1